MAIINTRYVPSILKLVPREECDDNPATDMSPQLGTPYCLDLQPMVSPLGLPCIEPPWGTLSAVDLNRGEVLWKVPLGTFEEAAPWPFSLMEGPPNIGGPAITASGLVFIAAHRTSTCGPSAPWTVKNSGKPSCPPGGTPTR